MEPKFIRESRCIKTARVFPNDVNTYNTLFGGRLMEYIDDIASISAVKHCRKTVVTASTDSVDFLLPIRMTDSVTLESYVTGTGTSSMEIFVKVVTEDLLEGNRKIAATSFLTFVALDEEGRPTKVPEVIPETEEEKKLFETSRERSKMRKHRRFESKKFAGYMQSNYPWE